MALDASQVPWFDAEELPDDQFCDVCKANEIPLKCIPIMQASEYIGNLPKFPKYTDFAQRRFSCCFCRLLSHLASPDKGPPEELVLSFGLSRYSIGIIPICSARRVEQDTLPPYCGIIRRSNARDTAPITNEIDYAAVKNLVARCEDGHDMLPAASRNTTQIIEIILIDVIQSCVIAATTAERYFALSYVWGRVTMLPLTSDNRQDLEQPGALEKFGSQLPLIIKDAMTFTRNMGERYLWIDVLCIVQDDLSQKMEQIRQMDIVYGSSALTLVSYSALSAADGLPGVQPFNLLLRMKQRILGTDFETDFLTFRDRTQSMDGTSKYRTRAWTFQEFLLSPRCMYFGYHDTIFACSHNKVHGIVSNQDDTFNLGRPLTKNILRQWTPDDFDDAVNAYGELLPTYTSKDLTESSDRLYAFAGCLSHLRGSLGLSIQGLPHAIFTKALLWVFDHTHGDTSRVRTRNNQFSSWSWAGWHKSCSMRWPQDAQTALDRVEVSSSNPNLPFPQSAMSVATLSSDSLMFSHEPNLGIMLHFDTQAISISHFSAHEISDSRYDQYTLRLHVSDGRWAGVLFGIEPEQFNRLLDDGDATYEFAHLATSSRTDSYRSQYIGWKQWEYGHMVMHEVLMIKWEGDISERVAIGKIHRDAFNAAEPKLKSVILR